MEKLLKFIKEMGLHGEEQLQQCTFSACTVKTTTAGWTDRGHKDSPKSIYNPHDRNDSSASPQTDSHMDMTWNKPRMGSDTIKACSLVYFYITLRWSLLAQYLIYSKYNRFTQKWIILPQVQLCNHNPANLTEHKRNKEIKTKQKAQTQEVWQEFSAL